MIKETLGISMNTSNQKYVNRFKDVVQPARAATRLPAAQPGAFRVQSHALDAMAAEAAIVLARGNDEALTAVFTWCVAVYLKKVSYGDAVILAVPGSHGTGWVALRAEVELAAPARVSLVHVRDELAALGEANVPTLERLPELLGMKASSSDNGICDTAVEFSRHGAPSDLVAGITLGLHFIRSGDHLRLEMRWRDDCFEAADIALIPGHIETILSTFCGDMSRPLTGVSLLSNAETARLLCQVNVADVEVDGPTSISGLFWEMADSRPNQVAVLVEGRPFTYGEVATRADRLATALVNHGVTRGCRVALMAHRDEWLLPAMLGILRAGCAYVPLDPGYPAERISWVLEDCGAAALVLSDGIALPSEGLLTLRANELPAGPTAQFPELEAEDTAYLIYTSGSTGIPKGVSISHGNVLNFFVGMDHVIPRSAEDTWLAITSISFDISVLELLWTLCRGVRVVLHPTGRLVEADERAQPRVAPAFSLFLFSDVDVAQARQHYELMFRAAEYADTHGMEAIWFPERHFHRFGGIFPNPSLAASALAMRTRRLHLRAGSVVSPLHNPLRIAEEWSFADNLSQGRIGVSFASGWNQRDFVLASSPFSERRQRVVDDLLLTQRFWRGEKVRVRAEGTEHELELFPRPVQPELPVWLTASSSVEAFRRAGELGVHLLTHLLHHSPEALREKIAAYRAAWTAHHGAERRGQVTLMVHTFIGDSFEQVIDTVREPFKRYLSSSAELMQAALPGEVSIEGLADVDREAILEAAFTRFVDERGLFGTPESCVTKVQHLQGLGVDEIACLVDFIPDPELVYAHLSHLSTLQRLVEREAAQLDVAAQIDAHRVTHFQCTPSLARALMDSARFRASSRHLKVFAVGGEAFPVGLQRAVHECSNARVLNMYGPTETTVWSTVQEVGDEQEEPAIGQPIANTYVRVFAEDGSPLPVNRVGELYIGGRGVAAGYWNRPELSRERFVADPVAGESSGRLYRTGDLVRINHEGAMHYLGRRDRQVKIRGHRIELGEIESRLRQQPGVRDAVVASLKRGETHRLCAFYRSDEPIAEESLDTALRAVLPEYMVPDCMLRVSEFPLTPNRKVDVKALLALLEHTASSRPNGSPRNPIQAALLGVWARVLGRDDLGVDDDFFRMGGDSVQAIQAAAHANAAGIAMNPRMLYEHPTVAQLADAVQPVAGHSDVEVLPTAEFGLLSAQSWFFSMVVPQRNHWNQSLRLTLKENTDPVLLRRAVEAAIGRHPAFRLRFRQTPDGWRQAYDRTADEPVGYLEVVASPAEFEAVVLEEAERAQRGLDLVAGPLIRAVHVRGLEVPDVLLLIAHHLVIDAVSWRIVLDDVARALDALKRGAQPWLPEAPGPHRAVRERQERMTSPQWEVARAFWRTEFETKPVALWKDGHDWREQQCVTRLQEAVVDADTLAAWTKRLRTDAESLTLAALVCGVRASGLGSGFAVDMESHGRGGAEGTEVAVGWLTRIYPVFVPSGAASLRVALSQVKAARREVEPFIDDYDVSSRGDGAASGGLPQPSVIFNYLGRLDASLLSQGPFTGVRLSPGTPRDPGAVRHHALEVNVHQTADGLVWEFIYPLELLSSEASDALVRACLRAYDELNTLPEADWSEFLDANDFPDASLTNEEVLRLVRHPGGVQDLFRATTHQRGIYFQLHACPSDRTRFVHQALIEVRRCEGERFTRALSAVATHHGAFRSSFFISKAGELVQAVFGEASLRVRRVDFRGLSEQQKENRLGALRKLDFEQGIDPERAPLTRAYLIQWGPDAYWLLWTYHHLIADGWSLPLMLRDVLDAYARQAEPAREPGNFGAFARWFYKSDKQTHQAFWSKYLEGCKPAVALSTAGHKQDFSYRVNYGVTTDRSDAASLSRWEALARGEGATFPALLQAALGVVLCRSTQQNSTVFGITVAGRPADLPQVDETVGLFINSVPLRFAPRVGESFAALIQRTHVEGSAVREHAYVEPAFLGGLMGLSPGLMPFETVLVVQNFDQRGVAMNDGGLELSVLDFVEHNPTPLTIEAVSGDGLNLRAVYDLAHFDAPQVVDLLQCLLSVMDEFAQGPKMVALDSNIVVAGHDVHGGAELCAE